MGFQSLEIGDGSSNKVKSNCSPERKTIVGVAIAALALGFLAGILIGHFGITTTDETVPVASGQEGCDTDAPGTPAPCLADDFLADAHPNVSSWIQTLLNASNIRENLRLLASKPHVAGTAKDFSQADMLRKFWLDNGLDNATTTPYNVTLSYPDTSKPYRFVLYDETLDDIRVEMPEDINYYIDREILPPFFAYAASGNVTRRRLVYANYGRPEDYDHLTTLGINFTDCIVMAKFGNGGRGSKVRFAEAHGVAGVILYSDPADWIRDDISLDDVYPKSVWISDNATQRGSIYGGIGDPLTPGFPATESAYRVEIDKIKGYWPGIPAMPIGYSAAEKIFQQMDGDVVNASWTGRLNVTYKYGFLENSTLFGNLEINNDNLERRTSYNAFGMIRGAVEPDRYVLLGNHRDSWIDGAIDPSSGTAVMMELSRVLGQLVKQGMWRPRRTILFCSWGSEEYALIGSTEWVEENARVLESRAVAYINMDIAITGNYTIRGLGSAPIFDAMYNAAKLVNNPDTGAVNKPKVYDDWVEKRPWKDPVSQDDRGFPVIPSPGGGSDYGTFQMRAGITCADFRYDEDFSGNLGFYSLYHTEDETFRAVDELLDPGFHFHVAIGQLSGELLRDLSDSLILPYNLTKYSIVLSDYTYNLYIGFLIDLKYYNINTEYLNESVATFAVEAVNFHTAVGQIDKNNPFSIRCVNDQMMLLDRTFLIPEGLPGEPQFKHILHSENNYPTGTGPSFAGLTDALVQLRENPDDSELQQTLKHHFSVVVFAIQSAATSLKEVTAFLRTQ